MKSKRQKIDDERDTSFGLPDSYLDHHKPGFKPVEEKNKVEPGHHRFSRVADEEDVPREPLAVRIARGN